MTYQRTVIVSPQADDVSSGTALRTALNGITATGERPILLKLEPGIYDIGAAPLMMKEFVDIEGSGEFITTIVGRVHVEEAGIVVGASRAELRSLTVHNFAIGSNGIYANSNSPRVTQVSVRSLGTGITLINSGATLKHLTVEVTRTLIQMSAGIGVTIRGGAPSLSHLKVNISDEGSGRAGIAISDSHPLINDAKVHQVALVGGSAFLIRNSIVAIRDSFAESIAQGEVSALASYNSSVELTNVALEVTTQAPGEKYAITNDGPAAGTL